MRFGNRTIRFDAAKKLVHLFAPGFVLPTTDDLERRRCDAGWWTIKGFFQGGRQIVRIQVIERQERVGGAIFVLKVLVQVPLTPGASLTPSRFGELDNAPVIPFDGGCMGRQPIANDGGKPNTLPFVPPPTAK